MHYAKLFYVLFCWKRLKIDYTTSLSVFHLDWGAERMSGSCGVGKHMHLSKGD